MPHYKPEVYFAAIMSIAGGFIAGMTGATSYDFAIHGPAIINVMLMVFSLSTMMYILFKLQKSLNDPLFEKHEHL